MYFREKCFRKKFCDFEEYIKWYHCFDGVVLDDLSKSGQRHFEFFKWNPHFLLYIFIAYFKSFSKYYNKIFFHQVLFEL